MDLMLMYTTRYLEQIINLNSQIKHGQCLYVFFFQMPYLTKTM